MNVEATQRELESTHYRITEVTQGGNLCRERQPFTKNHQADMAWRKGALQHTA